MPGIAHEIYNLLSCFDCFKDGGARYSVGMEYPPLYKKYKTNISRCPNLRQMICEKLKAILDRGPFEFDWVEIWFTRGGGLSINVPGDACGVFSSADGFYDHNIDTPNQCLALTIMLYVALGEIYRAITVWERDPQAGVVLESEDRDWRYRFVKDLNSKRFQLWNVISDARMVGEEVGIVSARSWEEAEEAAEKFYGNFYLVSRRLTEKSEPLSHLKTYEVVVAFDGAPNQNYKVIASSALHAEKMTKEMLDKYPLFWPIKDVKSAGEGLLIKPIIIKEDFIPSDV